MINDKCRICRRLGQKLFLKGDRCVSPKCALVKRAYPPGPVGKRKIKAPSEYKKSLQEKQKLRRWYGLSEHQFKKYVKNILQKRGKVQSISEELIRNIEKRLDNVVYRSGIAKSRTQARQMVSHGFFTVNNKSINIPSFNTKVGDLVIVKEHKKKKGIFKDIAGQIKRTEGSSNKWLEVNKETLAIKIKSEPSLMDIIPPAEISVIFEFYSK